MGAEMGIDARHQVNLAGNGHCISSGMGHPGKAAPAWKETPAAIL
jgi:hypothetical protein